MNKIVTNYIVIVGNKPVIMLSDKNKADKIAEMATQKNKKVLIRQVTGSETRINEIGFNLFKVKINDKLRQNIDLFRNVIVRKCLEYKDSRGVDEEIAWRRVCKEKAPAFKSMSYGQFCQWTLDVREYR